MACSKVSSTKCYPPFVTFFTSNEEEEKRKNFEEVFNLQILLHLVVWDRINGVICLSIAIYHLQSSVRIALISNNRKYYCEYADQIIANLTK